MNGAFSTIINGQYSSKRNPLDCVDIEIYIGEAVNLHLRNSIYETNFKLCVPLHGIFGLK